MSSKESAWLNAEAFLRPGTEEMAGMVPGQPTGRAGRFGEGPLAFPAGGTGSLGARREGPRWDGKWTQSRVPMAGAVSQQLLEVVMVPTLEAGGTR